MTFGDGALILPSLHASFYEIAVPVNAPHVRLEGHFSATGGAGNDISLFVMSQNGFNVWNNNHREIDALWESARTTVGDMSAMLPDGPGRYHLVFGNTFSLLTPKAVQQNIALSYYAP